MANFLLENKDSWDCKQLMFYCVKNKLSYKFGDILEKDWIPYGSVSFVEGFLGRRIKPNYFPKFLSPFISRQIIKTKCCEPGQFVKPADQYKKFDSFISTNKQYGDFICSSQVKFIDEWRYYVINGHLIDSCWYLGIDDTPKSAPKLDIAWPENWSGVADFGILENGKIELVESHHPFSCGWYGHDINLFAEFVIEGYNWMIQKKDLEFYKE